MDFPKTGGLFFSSVKNSGEDEHCADCFEIVYVIDGTAKFVSDGKEFSLNVGDGFIVAPFTMHGFPDGAGLYLRREVLVRSDIFLSAIGFLSPTDTPSVDFVSNKVTPFKLSLEEISFLESKLYNVYSYTDENVCHGFLNMFTSIVVGQTLFPSAISANDDSEFTKKCLSLCHSFYTDNQAAELVRTFFDYNDVYFGRKFKESFGCSLAEYINKLRIDTAVYFIINSKMTVEEICNHVGIYSIAYFIKLFKKHYGETPYKFRLSHRKNHPYKRRTD